MNSNQRFEADMPVNPNLKKAYENQVERIKYDEKMADREKVVRLYKYGDFWDTLVTELDKVERRARGEDVEDEDEPDMFTVEKNVNLRGQWNENLEESSWKKKIRSDHEVIKSEIRMCAKAALAMRRVALKQLFEKDFEMYEKELSVVGKTFYKQRI